MHPLKQKPRLVTSVRTRGRCKWLLCLVARLDTLLLDLKQFLKNCGQWPLKHFLTNLNVCCSLLQKSVFHLRRSIASSLSKQYALHVSAISLNSLFSRSKFYSLRSFKEHVYLFLVISKFISEFNSLIFPCIFLIVSVCLYKVCVSLSNYLCLSFKLTLSLFQTTSVSLSNYICLSFKLHLSLFQTTSVSLSN